MITANFHDLTEAEAQHVMRTLYGLVADIKTGHVHIRIGMAEQLNRLQGQLHEIREKSAALKTNRHKERL